MYIGICVLLNGNFCVFFYDGEELLGIEIILDDGKVLKIIFGYWNFVGFVFLFFILMFLVFMDSDKIIVCDFIDFNYVICFDDNFDFVWY